MGKIQMELIDIVNVLTAVISLGIVVRIIVCSLTMGHDDNVEVYKKSIKHCIIALIVTLSLCSVYNFLNSYYAIGVFI